MHKNFLNINNTALLIIDIQEKFKSAMYNVDNVIESTSRMVRAANILNIPVIYTEQYPKGLGNTVELIQDNFENAKRFEKVGFSCCMDNEFCSYLETLKRKQILICGVEAHVCVCQTVLDLLDKGYTPHIIVDAISSRALDNCNIAIEKMISSGAVISTVEIALFELIKGADHPNFREIQKLII